MFSNRMRSPCTEKAVSNFFKPASQKEPDKITWRIVNDSLLVGKYNGSSAESKQEAVLGKHKIAAFDFVMKTRFFKTINI
jgi:bifunctional polynucleotide phosphatase/kinase